MRRLKPTLRCKCTRCTAARRRRFFTVLAVCIAIAGSWKLLVEEQKPVVAGNEYLLDAAEGNSSYGTNESYAAEQAPQPAALRTPSYAENASPSGAPINPGNPRVSRERINAALAAGLIDPQGIGFVAAVVAAPTPEQDPKISSSDSTTSIPDTAPLKETGSLSANVALAQPLSPPPADPTSANLNVSRPSPMADKTVAVSQRRTTDIGPELARLAPHHRETPAKSPTTKNFSARLISRAEAGSSGSSPAEENIKGIAAPTRGTKPESSTEKKTDGSPSRDLSADLQRFAADFVRANQTGNGADRLRFFADSVHFYSEGDLSLASVDAASRRHRRDQQNKRTEVAEPGAATGPVNGGFYEINQPVRWTQSQGSQVTQGRSVLRLRVVPTSPGHWKITSIDEVSK